MTARDEHLVIPGGHRPPSGLGQSALVAAGFMPAFKYRQKNSLFEPVRGRKARAYEEVLFSDGIFPRRS
jgi:hypothetical protein